MESKKDYIPSDPNETKKEKQTPASFARDEEVLKEIEEKLEKEIIERYEEIEKRAEKYKKIQEQEKNRLRRERQADLEKTEVLDIEEIKRIAKRLEDIKIIDESRVKSKQKNKTEDIVLKDDSRQKPKQKSRLEDIILKDDSMPIYENETFETENKPIEEKIKIDIKPLQKVEINENQETIQSILEKQKNKKEIVEEKKPNIFLSLLFKKKIKDINEKNRLELEKRRELEEKAKQTELQKLQEKEEAKLKRIAEFNAKQKEIEAKKLEDKIKKEQARKENVTRKGVLQDKKLMAEAEKKRKLEEKEKQKKIREEKRKEEIKKEIEEKLIRQKEQEDRNIILLKEKLEQKKRIEKEKEQAREERREKAKLIEKAKEESKQKEQKERKTIEEKIKEWYENLSIVKDNRNRRELQRQTLLIDYESAEAVRSEDKIMYKYLAKNKETGKLENGYFSAFSKLDVLSFLIAENYEVYEILPQRNLFVSLKIFMPKFKSNDLDFFLTQLSTFLKAGITLIDAVKVLSKQCKDKSQKQVYKAIIYELTLGENFSEALYKQGNVFPKLLINMIKTSELTGDLPETLDDMANYYKEMEKTRKQMISAITYPTVILGFALTILVFIMVVVIPQFVTIYGDLNTELPGITVAVIKTSNFLKNYWQYTLLGVAAFILLFIFIFKKVKVFRTAIQTLLMNTPIIGKIIIYNEITMFTKTFGSLLNHNVYITDAMEVLSKITNNEIYKMMIYDTITNLAKGDAISNSFKNHWAFPEIAYEMILTGEKTGQLGNMMDKVAEYYQAQHKNAVNQIKAFIEPVMIVMLAAIVGVILLSVVLPMFDMYQNIGG